MHSIRNSLGVVLGFALVASAGISAHAADVTVYEETFPSPGVQPPSQDEQLRIEGWCGGNAGDEFCNNPPGTIANQGGEGAISVGNGQDGNPGFAFWSQKGIAADSFLYTEEFEGSTDLSVVSWYQRDSGEEPLHLAFKIGGTWYISDQTWTQPDSNQWLQQTADLTVVTFFTRNQGGSTLPDGGVPVASPNLPLPAGDVDAFGFWWDGKKSANSRIDTVKLIAPDDDNDGVGDAVDACVPSSGVGQPVVIDGCTTSVVNPVDTTGCTISDRVQECVAGAGNHGLFVSCVSQATNAFRAAGLISGREKGAIQRCAARSDLP